MSAMEVAQHPVCWGTRIEWKENGERQWMQAESLLTAWLPSGEPLWPVTSSLPWWTETSETLSQNELFFSAGLLIVCEPRSIAELRVSPLGDRNILEVVGEDLCAPFQIKIIKPHTFRGWTPWAVCDWNCAFTESEMKIWIQDLVMECKFSADFSFCSWILSRAYVAPTCYPRPYKVIQHLKDWMLKEIPQHPLPSTILSAFLSTCVLCFHYNWNINSASLLYVSGNLMAELHPGSPSHNSARNWLQFGACEKCT